MLLIDAKTIGPIRKKILPLIPYEVEGVGLSRSYLDGLTRGRRPRTTVEACAASERHCRNCAAEGHHHKNKSITMIQRNHRPAVITIHTHGQNQASENGKNAKISGKHA